MGVDLVFRTWGESEDEDSDSAGVRPQAAQPPELVAQESLTGMEIDNAC